MTTTPEDTQDLPPAPVAEEFCDYDAGLLNDWGGGNVEWWQDYIRSEINRANEFWREQTVPLPLYTHPQPAVPDVDALAEFLHQSGWHLGSGNLAQAICNWIEEQQQ